MRELGGIVAALVLGACATEEPAPGGPGTRSAQHVEIQSDIVLAPSEPTPAFVPVRGGQCPRAYRLVDGSCVHHAYVAADDAALRRALSAYQRGAVPPMLGQPKPSAAPASSARRPLDPGALSKGARDAGVGRERRLAELDAMIAAAKEKLRERDERSRARRVEAPPRTPAAPTAGVPATPPPPAIAGSAGAVPSADPVQARLGELSQLASQLPPDQLQAITAELGKAGMDMQQLEQLLSSARGGDAPR